MVLGSGPSQALVGVPRELIEAIAADPKCRQLKAKDDTLLPLALSQQGIAALTPTAIGAIVGQGGESVRTTFDKFVSENANPEVVTCIGRRIAELAAGQITPASANEAAVLANVYLRPIRTGETLEKLGAPIEALKRLAEFRQQPATEGLDALDVVGFDSGARTGTSTYELMGNRLKFLATQGRGLTLAEPLVAVLATKINEVDIRTGKFDALLGKLAMAVRAERKLSDNNVIMKGLDGGVVACLTSILTQHAENKFDETRMELANKCRDQFVDFALSGSKAALAGCTLANAEDQLSKKIERQYEICSTKTIADQQDQRTRARSGEFRALGRVLGNIIEGTPAQEKGTRFVEAARTILGRICCADLSSPMRTEIIGRLREYPGIQPVAEAVRFLEDPASYFGPIEAWVKNQTTGAPQLKFNEVQRKRGTAPYIDGKFITEASPHVRAAIIEAAGSALKSGYRGAEAAAKLLQVMSVVVSYEDPKMQAAQAPRNKEVHFKVVAEALFSGRIISGAGLDKKIRNRAEEDLKHLKRGIRAFLKNNPEGQKILTAAQLAAQERLKREPNQIKSSIPVFKLESTGWERFRRRI